MHSNGGLYCPESSTNRKIPGNSIGLSQLKHHFWNNVQRVGLESPEGATQRFFLPGPHLKR